MVDKRTKNHINGIEGFWSYAKHILYNYRGVSQYHFPMYLKEGVVDAVEYDYVRAMREYNTALLETQGFTPEEVAVHDQD